MEWVSSGKLTGWIGLLAYVVVASSEDFKYVSYSSQHLDAALNYYDTLHVGDISHATSADPGSSKRHVSFSALGRRFHMRLDIDQHILTRDFAVYSVDSEGSTQLHDIDQRAFLHGHLQGEEDSSLITAHLSSEGILTAVIVSSNQTYHVEPSRHYIREPHPFHMVAYEAAHVKQRLNATKFDFTVPPLTPPNHKDQPTFNKDGHTPSVKTPVRRLRRQTVERGRIGGDSCNMILVADHTAFQLFGDVQSTSSQLVLLLSSVDNLIYRRTPWILDVDNSTITGLGHTIQTILVHTSPSNDPSNYTYGGDLDASDILGRMRFGPWQDFCLAHIFTNRNFLSGLLGLANIASPVESQTGGICSRSFPDNSVSPRRTLIFNTGLSTYNNNGQIMILSEMIRVTGHELGHNWGSHHDPATRQCENFLMNEYAQDGSDPTHMVFSSCSRRSIGQVLLTKGFCFGERRSVECGDYQVEGGEECDVGPEGDECCTSSCTLTADCSDRNSLCCRGCQVAGPTEVCRTGPRLSADCTADTFCEFGGENVTCPLTPEPAANGTQCIQGICLFTEDSGAVPECVPLCNTLGMSLCSCVGIDECMVCCINSTGMCSRLSPGLPLSNGSSCSSGVCNNGMCSSRTQDEVSRIWEIITSLNASAFREFVEKNVVGFTLIFSIPVWCLFSCLLHWLVDYPRRKRFERSLENVDFAKLLAKQQERPMRRVRRAASAERKPLLVNEEDSPPREPVDDQPPPVYHSYS